MGSIASERRGVNAKALFATALADAQAAVTERLAAAVAQGWERQLDGVLGREAYARREQVAPWVEVRGRCQRCKSRQSRRFSRNGRRVLQVDAIWVTQLVPTGSYHRDAKGRLRPAKKRLKRPIFIALGVWPETGQAEVLAWRLAAQEDEAEWLAFLSELEALGIRGEHGLELVIHDGGSGLGAALHTLYFGAAEQRCLFHKLRNLYHAIRLPDEALSRREQRQRRKAIFRDFHQIWEAKRLATVLPRYLHVVRPVPALLARITQPEAVACLRTGFRATIAYFAVHARHPDWDRKHLRTTSRLERFNRRLRRRARAAAAYHSDAGLCAMLAHEVQVFNTGKCQP